MVAVSVVSGVGAVPTLERGEDPDGEPGPLEIVWGSSAGAAGAAVWSGTPGLSCPSGMVLDEGLCKTPVIETVAVVRVCAQAGYELVDGVGELGESYSCQRTVAAFCAGAKVLHEGQCRTETVEQRDPVWVCSVGTLVSTLLDPGYAYSCRVTLDPPECPDGESYRTTPSSGCYEYVESYETAVTTSGPAAWARWCRRCWIRVTAIRAG